MPSDDPADGALPADLPEPAPDVPGDPAAPARPRRPETPGDPATPSFPAGNPGAPGDPNPSNAVSPGAVVPVAAPLATGPAGGAGAEAPPRPSWLPPDAAPAPEDAGTANGVTEDALRLAEGLIFASATPVPASRLAPLLGAADPEEVLRALAARYAGRGVTLANVAGGWCFRTAADLAPALTTVIETPRRLPRAAMEALAIIAWHQPVTRPEIEDIRGTAVSQPTMELLLENALVAPRGRKEAPGRPTLWVTTPRFLEQFALASLRDLPRREDLLPDPVLPFGDAPSAALAPRADEPAAPGDDPSPDGAGEGLRARRSHQPV